MDWQHKVIRFGNLGLAMKQSLDALAPGQYLRLTNADSPAEGQVQARDGLLAQNAVALPSSPVHSIINFLDAVAGVSTYHVGSGATLYYGALSSLSAASIPANLPASGSGKPLSFAAYRPTLDPYVWDYIADSNRMLKMNRSGSVFGMGIAPPSVPASVSVQPPSDLWIDGGTPITGADSASWVPSSPSGAGSIAVAQAALEVIAAIMPGDNSSPGNVQSLLATLTIGSPASSVFDLSRTITADLSKIGTASATDEDQIRLFVKIDDPTLYQEIRILFNLSGSDPTFSKDYYVASFAPPSAAAAYGTARSPIAAAVSRDVTLRLNRRLLLETADGSPRLPVDPGSGAPDLYLGTATWNAIAIKRGAFTRVGSDQSRTWATVTGIRFEVILAPGVAPTATPALQFYGLDIQGSAGLDASVANASLYDWRYTYLNINSGAESNPSPMMTVYSTLQGAPVFGTQAVKQVAQLTPSVSADPQVTHIVWYRRGGTLPQMYLRVGLQPNGGSFLDAASDSSIESAIPLSFDNDQPFTTSKPVAVASTLSGSVTNAPAYASVQFSNVTNLAVGMTVGVGVGSGRGEFVTVEAISGLVVTAYFSNNHSLGESVVGAGASALYGQPLPYIWGPFQGYILGAGDPNRPGYLYWCNHQNPDGASSSNNVEVSQPSDPIMNGFIYNQQPFVWTKERLYMIATGSPGISTFIPYQTSCQRGILAPWAFCVGDQVYFLAKDGIYATQGGAAISLTEGSMWPIFHGRSFESYSAIDLTQAASHPEKYRMFYSGAEVHLIYPDTNGVVCEIAYYLPQQRWRAVSFDGVNPTVGYWQEEGIPALYRGSNSGFVFSESGGTDAGNPIHVAVRTGAQDMGAPRDDKLFGDIEFECDPGGGSVSVTPYLNSEATALPSTVISGSARVQTLIPLGYSGGPPTVQGKFGKNLLLDIAWDRTASANQIIYQADIAYLPRPERSQQRALDWTDAGIAGMKYVRAVALKLDTFGSPIDILVQSGPEASPTTQATLAGVSANGVQSMVISFDAFRATLLRILPITALPLRIYDAVFVSDPDADYVTAWDTGWEDGGWPFDKYVTGLEIQCDTQNAPKTIHVQAVADNGAGPAEITGSPFYVTQSGRGVAYVAFPQAVYARMVRMYSPASGLTPSALYAHQWIFDKEPLKISNFASNWSNLGWPQDKRIKGLRVEGDTLNQAKTVLLQGGPAGSPVTLQSLTVQLNGRDIQQFGFPEQVARIVRLWPTDANPGKMYEATFIFDKEPENIPHYETQPTDLGVAGYKHSPYLLLGIRSNGLLTITVTMDGASPVALQSINSTGGARKVVPVYLPANKFRNIKWAIDSAGGATSFYVYREDCAVYFRGWGSSSQYQLAKPFGGPQ